MKSRIAIVVCSIGLCFSMSSWGNSIEITSIDHGANDLPEEGAPHPGETGAVYLTLKNTGAQPIRDIALKGFASDCIMGLEPILRIPELLPRRDTRVESPLYIAIHPDCTLHQATAFELRGAYLDPSGTRVPVQVSTFYRIGGAPAIFDHLNETLRLPISDGGFTDYAIDVNSAGIVRDIGIEITILHPIPSEVSVTLIHPDGTSVILLRQYAGQGRPLNLSYGMGGTHTPYQSLSQLFGKTGYGQWKLRIRDHILYDSGHVSRVRFRLKRN